MGRSYKHGSGDEKNSRNQHKQVRGFVKGTLDRYDPETDDDIDLPEVKMKRKPPIGGGKIELKWYRGPDKREIE